MYSYSHSYSLVTGNQHKLIRFRHLTSHTVQVAGISMGSRTVRSSIDKAARFQESTQRKVRKLSGWNIFQREGLRDAKSLSPAEYKVKVQRLSNEWKQFSPEQKDPYNIQALHEQECRETLAETPLGLKGEGKSELELQVGRKGCSKLSSKRLAVNRQQYSSHPFWSLPTKFGDGALVLQKQFDDSYVLHFLQ